MNKTVVEFHAKLARMRWLRPGFAFFATNTPHEAVASLSEELPVNFSALAVKGETGETGVLVLGLNSFGSTLERHVMPRLTASAREITQAEAIQWEAI
jgi:hypothetical protein